MGMKWLRRGDGFCKLHVELHRSALVNSTGKGRNANDNYALAA